MQHVTLLRTSVKLYHANKQTRNQAKMFVRNQPIEAAIEHFRQLFDYVIDEKGLVYYLKMPPKGDFKLNQRLQNLWQSVIREFKCNSDIVLHDLA